MFGFSDKFRKNLVFYIYIYIYRERERAQDEIRCVSCCFCPVIFFLYSLLNIISFALYIYIYIYI